VARTGEEMKDQLKLILNNPFKAKEVADHGQQTIRSRHTCAHRVNELETVCEELGIDTSKIFLTPKEQVLHER